MVDFPASRADSQRTCPRPGPRSPRTRRRDCVARVAQIADPAAEQIALLGLSEGWWEHVGAGEMLNYHGDYPLVN